MLTLKNTLKLASIAVLLIFVGLIAVCRRAPLAMSSLPESTGSQYNQWANEPILPIPDEIKLDVRKVRLGEKLFNDTHLSHNNEISCATCHSLDMGGTDHLARSVGINGQVGNINAPTVLNAAYNFKQFWDGRAETLEEQIDGPTHAAGEMGSNWEEITEKLGKSPEYVSIFAPLYKDGIQVQNIKDAIATFERSLITPDSRFDRFLKGDPDILSKEEKEGYRLFKSVGCASCHQGVNIGGNLFQEFGVMGNYFNDRGNITSADFGRYNVTKKENDKYVFKVPSLRNVELTAPYFHDGSA
jgi:cytochrome c peroxidase